MNEIEICPVKIYTFRAAESLIQEVERQIETVTWESNINNLISSDYFYNENMISWFDQCIEQVRKIKYPKMPELVITTCWANKTTRLKSHHRHYHPNSIISGIFYITDCETGVTQFEVQDPWYLIDNNTTLYMNDKIKHGEILGESIKTKNSPKKGTLILFPSSLYHSVRPLNETVNRYSVSFNTFVKGKLGDHIAMELDIGAKSLREKIAQRSVNVTVSTKIK